MPEPSRAVRPMSAPERIQQMHFSFGPERILSAAIQLGVFSHIAAGKRSAPEIAAAAGASERGMRMLLDALVPFELLTKRQGHYELSADAARYLVRESPDYMGALYETNTLWEMWGHLADSVRTGKPQRSANDRAEAEKFFPVLIRSLHITNRELSQRLAAALVAPGARRGLQVLDVGCGSAVWSIAIAKADTQALVTALDFPGVLGSTRQYVSEERLTDRYEFVPGDLNVAEFPVGRYDVALLGNIVHGENEKRSRDLFRRMFKALGAGGRLVIIDMIPNDERTGPVFPLLFALNMLVNTEEGGCYTLAEYRAWLKDAGFASIETIDIASHSPVIVATKAAS